jgi:hypothetical protein
MTINETLKFSWGHIIAFVAIIFISYISFMGISYLTDGDFLLAGLGVVGIDILIVLFFIGAQLMKGSDEKFKRRIAVERILLFAAPFVFCVVMIPYAHFWTVFDRRNNIENTFSSSLMETKGMFDSYKTYSDNRIKEYDAKLVRDKVGQIRRENKVKALKLQLVADNYVNLKKTSCEWIDRASNATVWNVFMLGNIHKINEALENWNSSLTTMSQKKMSDEDQGVLPFTSEDASVVQANKDLASLNGLYSSMNSPTWIAIVSGVFLMLMLLFPYVIQNRNTKSTYRLLGTEEANNKHIGRKVQKRIKKEHPEDSPFELTTSETSNRGDYDSFNM